jgi:predicted Zn-dependent protease
VQLELNRPALLDRAIANLRAALAEEHDAPFTWRQLAIAYGRKGNLGMSSLALAEEALLTGDKAAATYQAGRAERLLPEGSPAWLKSQDILQAIDKKE